MVVEDGGPKPRFSGVTTATTVSAAAGCAVVVLLLRAPEAFSRPQMWAEDAAVFWMQQYLDGWAAVVIPYAGYLHLAPRLTAAVASLFDVAFAPVIFVWASAILIGWAAATAATTTANPLLGMLLGATLTLAPHPTGEVLGNLANVQWLMASPLALLLLSDPPKTQAKRVNQSAFALIAGLSGPFSTLLLPLSFRRLVRSKDSTTVLCFLAGVIQLTVLVVSQGQHLPSENPDPLHLIVTMLGRCVSENPWVATTAIGVVAASIIAPYGRALRVGLLFLATTVLITTAIKFLHMPHSFDLPENGSRYFYIPQLVLIWCAISLCFCPLPSLPIGLALVIMLTLNYPREFFRRQSWPDQHWADHVKRIGSESIEIPILPPGWKITVPPR